MMNQKKPGIELVGLTGGLWKASMSLTLGGFLLVAFQVQPSFAQQAAVKKALTEEEKRVREEQVKSEWQAELHRTDYKTGKFPKPAYMNQKWFQLLLYKLVVEKTIGKQVKEVQLIYLKDGKSIGRKTTLDDDKSTLERVANVYSEIQSALQTGEFPTKVSRLCDWCYYKGICPAWTARRNR